jgi:hypothetical protein
MGFLTHQDDSAVEPGPAEGLDCAQPRQRGADHHDPVQGHDLDL